MKKVDGVQNNDPNDGCTTHLTWAGQFDGKALRPHSGTLRRYVVRGLVVRVLSYRPGGPSSIPGTTRKKKEWSETGSTQPCEYN
jgi:hypothetical protein